MGVAAQILMLLDICVHAYLSCLPFRSSRLQGALALIHSQEPFYDVTAYSLCGDWHADFLDPSTIPGDASEQEEEEDAVAKGPKADLRPPPLTPEDAEALEPNEAMRMLHVLARCEYPLLQVSS